MPTTYRQASERRRARVGANQRLTQATAQLARRQAALRQTMEIRRRSRLPRNRRAEAVFIRAMRQRLPQEMTRNILSYL